MSQENVKIARQVYGAWGRGDFTATVSLLDRNATLVIDASIPDGGGVFVGPEGVATYMRRFLDAWHELTIAGESFRAVGDTVLIRVKQTGIGKGSGVPVDITYFHLMTFRGGKVIRLDAILDEAEALEAVGLSE